MEKSQKVHRVGAMQADGAVSDRFNEQLQYSICKDPDSADDHDVLVALCLALRRTLTDAMSQTQARYRTERPKRIYYLSMEFLIGQSLVNNALNLGLLDECSGAVSAIGSDLDRVAALEPDAALGNGGLGRLAACFIDSMATLGIAGFGCGIRYDFGLFKQQIVDCRQREKPDSWSADTSPWLIERRSGTHQIPLYGQVVDTQDANGRHCPMWLDWKSIMGVPYDMPIAGFGGRTVNHLRLYAARASDSFDIEIFNTGDYLRAVEQKIASETVSKVLYPSDAMDAGRELRLIQEYFLVACSIRDVMKEFLEQDVPLAQFPQRVAIQMNDTHPALAVAELMRTFVDEYDVPWDEAWGLTRETLAYTNHTLLPEALERWPVELVGRVLPRHLQIIYEINRRFLAEVRDQHPDDEQRIARLSIIEEGSSKQVRMANLAIVGSHSVNGVAALHSRLITTNLVPDFFSLYPEKFNNKTNGVTPRRWILQANPSLASVLNDVAGVGWVTDMSRLRKLEKLGGDSAFIERIAAIKLENKERLARFVYAEQRVKLDPSSIFDVQVKRIHEYKRQLLHILHVIHLYQGLQDRDSDAPPRTHIFSGKAAPGYYMAKLVIELINRVAVAIRSDPRAKGRLNVVFIPDYRVSAAEQIIPAADLSEQISTAGMEASGTGNMKFAMNGAMTVGTHDGANIEMAAEIGAENFYLFGRTAAEIEALRTGGAYRPRELYESDPRLRGVIDSLVSGQFARDTQTFRPIYDALLGKDWFCVLADFHAYVAIQQQAASDFKKRHPWFARTIFNIARSGPFSSDRTIKEYAQQIWRI